jgi:hypothetical protein
MEFSSTKRPQDEEIKRALQQVRLFGTHLASSY